MIALARQPSVESHRVSRQRFVNLRKSLSTLPPGRVNPNFARMNIEEGEDTDLFEVVGDEDEQVMVEVEPNAESSERNDWLSDAESEEVLAQDDVTNADADYKNERERRKLALLKMAASYDRGFSASPSARKLMSDMIADMESLNPTKDAARGVSGDALQGTPPLQGKWRMIWHTSDTFMKNTTSLLASFVSSPTVGACYDIFNPPVFTSTIDVMQRPQNLQPSSICVQETVYRTSPQLNSPNRVVTTPEFGTLKFPQVSGLEIKLPASALEMSTSYFDVAYLDDDMLIQRHESDSCCVLIRVDSYEP